MKTAYFLLLITLYAHYACSYKDCTTIKEQAVKKCSFLPEKSLKACISRRLKRSACFTVCETSDCETNCSECDCTTCKENECSNNCNSCCQTPQTPCTTRYCCYRKCYKLCDNTSCRRDCRSNCAEKLITEESNNMNPPVQPNVSTIINIHSRVNNEVYLKASVGENLTEFHNVTTEDNKPQVCCKILSQKCEPSLFPYRSSNCSYEKQDRCGKICLTSQGIATTHINFHPPNNDEKQPNANLSTEDGLQSATEATITLHQSEPEIIGISYDGSYESKSDLNQNPLSEVISFFQPIPSIIPYAYPYQSMNPFQIMYPPQSMYSLQTMYPHQHLYSYFSNWPCIGCGTHAFPISPKSKSVKEPEERTVLLESQNESQQSTSRAEISKTHNLAMWPIYDSVLPCLHVNIYNLFLAYSLEMPLDRHHQTMYNTPSSVIRYSMLNENGKEVKRMPNYYHHTKTSQSVPEREKGTKKI